MALKAGTAYVDVAAKVATGFQGDVDKAITPGMDATGKKAGGILSSSFGKAAAVAGAGALAVKGTEFLKGAVDAARESAKIAAQSEQVVKSTGGAAHISADQMGELATSISKKTAVDDEAIQSAENLLATFTNVKNEVGAGNDIFNQATATMVDMGAALGTDASASAIQLGKALNDPVKGISALSRVGVTFTEQQKEQIKSMVEAGDVAGAQKVILNELGKEFGGQAAAQATSADKLSVSWGNVQEEIGGKLIPILDKVSGFLADHTGLIVPLAGVIAGVLVVAFAAWAISAATAAAATIAAAAPILAIVAAVAAVGVAIYLLVKNWDEIWTKIKEIVGAAFEAVKRAIGGAIDWLKNNWQLVLAILTGPIGLAVKFIIDHWNGIVDFVTGLPGRIASAASGMWDGIKNAFKAAINWIIRGWNSLEFSLPKVDTHIPGVGKIGGWTLGTPNIPELRGAGGPAMRGKPYIIGEGGPELFVPRATGGITSNAQLLEALGTDSRSGAPLAGATIKVDARGRRDDPWYLGSTLNRSLRELAHAEGWS